MNLMSFDMFDYCNVVLKLYCNFVILICWIIDYGNLYMF